MEVPDRPESMGKHDHKVDVPQDDDSMRISLAFDIRIRVVCSASWQDLLVLFGVCDVLPASLGVSGSTKINGVALG